MGKPHVHAVLLVDDSEDTVAALAFYLESIGFTVETETDGKGALERLASGFRPCSLLVDVMMPQMTGWELVRRVRNTPSLTSIPVVVYSGVREDVARAQALGIVAYVLKPGHPRDIAAALVKQCPHGSASK